MKNFWLPLTGPQGLWSPQNRQALTQYLLAPLLTFYLVAAQIKDVLAFIPLLFWRRAPTTSASTINPLVAPAWANANRLTFALVVVVGLTLAYLSFLFGREARGQFEVSPATQQNTPTVKERVFSAPTTIKLNDSSVSARLDETAIRTLAAKAQALSLEEKNLLTQVEALNYALAFYYLGDQNNYQFWLKWGSALDPNSSLLNP